MTVFYQDWPRWVFLGLEWQWTAAGAGCLCVAAALAARPSLPGRLEKGLAAHPRAPWLFWGLWIPGWVILFKLAQYRSYQLMPDSAVFANIAWNAGQGRLLSSVMGESNPLSNHFALTAVLFAPLARLWPSAAPLAAVQAAAVGSAVLGVWLLARRAGAAGAGAWAVALLALSHRFFHDLAGSALDETAFAFPLFIWAAWLWSSGRRGWAALPAALLLTTRESAPMALLGFGLFLSVKRADRRLGLCLVAAAVLITLGELAAVRHIRGETSAHWGVYGSLGASQEEVLRNALTRPWRVAVALAWPPEKLMDAALLAASLAFLPLGAGAAALPALAAWLPHQWADAGTAFHELSGHTSGVAFGPLLWAAAAAAGRAGRRPKTRRFLWALVLAVSGLNFLRNSDFWLRGLFPSAWGRAGPRAMAHIPGDAKLWCDPFFLPHLAMRRHVRALPPRLSDPWFDPNPFVPERVLLSVHWTRLAPEASAVLLGFLKERGYRPLFQEADLVVLAPSLPANAPP